jgi:hypothetical protein
VHVKKVASDGRPLFGTSSVTPASFQGQCGGLCEQRGVAAALLSVQE